MKPEERIQGEGDAALAFAFAGLFCGVALLPATQLLDLKRAAGLAAAALLWAGLAWRSLRGRPPTRLSPALLPVLVWPLAAWLLCVLAAPIRSGVMQRGPLLAGGLALAWGLATAPAAWRRVLASAWRVSLLGVALYALLQRVGVEFVPAFAQAGSRTRAMASFGNAGYLAAFLCLSWPAFLAWQGARRAAALTLVFAALLASGSRAALLALGLQGALLVYDAWPRLDAAQRRRLAAALGAGAALLAWLLLRWWRPSLRPQIWVLGLRVWLQHPVFGWGPGSFALAAEPLLSPALRAGLQDSRQFVEDPHQLGVLLLAEGGLLGAAAFAAAAWGALRLARRRPDALGRALWLGGLGLLAESSVDRFFFSAGVFLPLCALLGLAAADEAAPPIRSSRWLPLLLLAGALSLGVWAWRPLQAWRDGVGRGAGDGLDGTLAAADVRDLQAEAERSRAPDAWGRVGEALATRGDFERALPAYRQALALEPSAGRAQNVGNCLMMLQRPAEAEAAYRQAVALDPASADARFSLGYALFVQKRLKPAVDALDQALRLDPGHAGALKLKEQILQ